MKFTHKIAKLVQPLTYRRAWRRAERHLHPVSVAAVSAAIDPAQLKAIQDQYSGSTEHYAKYADVPRWLRLNIVRAQDLKLHRSSPQSILDLGCGGGFFLFVAQRLGHDCVGLDADGFPLFGQLLDLFKVERRIWTIEPFQPLPNLGRKFDLITAFSVEFNRKGEWWWGPAEWTFFLDDLARFLKPGGQIFLGLNPGKDKRFYTDELRDFFLSRGASIERENIRFPAARPE